MQICLCYVIICMAEHNPELLQIAAADYVGRRKGMPEQMSMQPFYSGRLFHSLEELLDQIICHLVPGSTAE